MLTEKLDQTGDKGHVLSSSRIWLEVYVSLDASWALNCRCLDALARDSGD